MASDYGDEAGSKMIDDFVRLGEHMGEGRCTPARCRCARHLRARRATLIPRSRLTSLIDLAALIIRDPTSDICRAFMGVG